MAVVSTKRARSASSRTRGSDPTSSPETISAPISPSGGLAASPQAAATPRPFGVRGRKYTEAFPPSPSARAAICAPPAGSSCDQTTATRPARLRLRAAERSSLGGLTAESAAQTEAALPGATGTDPAGWIVMTSAPSRRAWRSQRSTIGDRGQRRPEAVERRVERLGQERRPRPKALLDEARGRRGLFHGLRSRERYDHRSLGLAETALPFVEGLFPGDRLEPAAANALERPADAVVGPQVLVGEAALVADPAGVDLGVVARQDARHLPLTCRRPHVAADGTKAADGRHVLDLPRPRPEAVRAGRKRAHGTELDHVAREGSPVRLVLERGDEGLGTAVDGHELPVFGDELGKASAAVAEDAALAVEPDQRRDRDRLVERALREAHARVSRTPAEGQVLQGALAALVAVGAVERMIQEDELEDGVLALRCLLAGLGRAQDEAVLGGHRAGGLELRHPFDRAEAHATCAHRRA